MAAMRPKPAIATGADWYLKADVRMLKDATRWLTATG